MKSKCDILIHNGIIVTVDKENRIFEPGFVAIKDQSVVGLGHNDDADRFSAGETIDAKNGIVMPGLINAHCHTPMSLFRGLADDLPLMTWLNDYMFRAEAEYINPEATLLGAKLSCVEMLLSGTTLVCDGYFHEEMVVEALLQTGMKGVAGHGVIDFPAPGVPDPAKNVRRVADYITRFKNRYNGIYPSVFCHSPYTCSIDTLKKAKKLAYSTGVLFQIHVSETGAENAQIIEKNRVTPVKFLYENGLLDSNTLLAHCVWVDEADMEIISSSGASVAHCPESNMKLGSGTAPVAEMIKRGINVALGTDGCASNNNLDLFSEMDTAAKLQKVATLDPSVADAATVLRMATINGAAAIGLENETGSLEIGKKADIIILDASGPHLVPMYNPVSQIVYSASGADVRDVLIDGKPVIKNRKHCGLDINKLMEEIRQFASGVSIKRARCH